MEWREPSVKAPKIIGLIRDVLMARKITEKAKQYGLSAQHMDRAEFLVRHVEGRVPILIILDWEGCEPECFKLLKQMTEMADLKKVPVIGFFSKNKQEISEEARRAGCDRLYGKSEFISHLDELLIRYAR